MGAATEPKYKTSGVRLTRLEQWWANLLPLALRKMLPPWWLSGLVLSILALWVENSILPLSFFVVTFWLTTALALFLNKVRRRIGQTKSLTVISLFYGTYSAFYSLPALAQEAQACSSMGILTPLTNFVVTILGGVTFSSGTGEISTLLCQAIGLFVIFFAIGFIVTGGNAVIQTQVRGEPIHTAVQPLIGFFLFIVIVSVVLGSLIGGETP